MKRIIVLSTLLALLAASSCNVSASNKDETANTVPDATVNNTQAPSKTKIQVAILLDTSGSMDGLIEQAKSRLWNIVNTLTTLKYNGQTPEIEIALYEYGSYNRYDGDFMRQITPLTTDLDQISKELFVLTAGGSEEYCGTVIGQATRNLDWGNNESDMKLIYIAGNEVFSQGKISYKTSIQDALKKNIYVNTIHCGNRDMGIKDLWQDAAERGEGKFFNIDSDAAIRYIETPYDDKISHCNRRLNDTYISYGAVGNEKKMNQRTQDDNAMSISAPNYVERTVSKSKAAYKNDSWDLVDLVKKDGEALSKIKKEELPDELRNKTKAEQKAFIAAKQKEREALQNEIAELAIKRQAYIDEQLQKQDSNQGDGLGKAITESILAFAQKKGYDLE